MSSMYQVELVWSREVQWMRYGKPHDTLKDAINAARAIENSGDGARVKKSRVISLEDERVVWAYGRRA